MKKKLNLNKKIPYNFSKQIIFNNSKLFLNLLNYNNFLLDKKILSFISEKEIGSFFSLLNLMK